MFAAESILGDSVAARAHRTAHAFGQDAFMMPFERVEPPELVTIQDFNCDPKGVVRKVTEWSAKAAAAFHGSMDALDTFGAQDAMYRFNAGQHIRRKMLRPLMDLHAFDKGDEQQMRVLEDVRGKLIESMTDPNDVFSRMQRFIPVPKYAEFDSKETLFGQAADLAAGIASTHFQREGIAGLVSRFEMSPTTESERGVRTSSESLMNSGGANRPRMSAASLNARGEVTSRRGQWFQPPFTCGSRATVVGFLRSAS